MTISAISLPPSTPARSRLASWPGFAALTNTPAEVIAIDGKTSRRSYQSKGSKEAIHIVSAFAARQRIVLGQVKVNEKSNEIAAIRYCST